MAKKHTQRSLTAWQADYEKLESQYNRQQELLEKLQNEKRATEKDKSSALTSLVAWLLGQGYSMVARGKK